MSEDAIAAFVESESTAWRRTPGASVAESLIELAGRVCYMSFGERQSDRTNARYIQNLLTQGHESVLEHVSWTFVLAGVSRAFTHQLVRHRPGFSYSQTSQQYFDHSSANVVMPSSIAANPGLAEQWQRAVETSFDTYKLLSHSIDDSLTGSNRREAIRAIRSAARSVLPESTEAKIVVTANARAIRHFLTVRGALEGEEEMRKVSALILGEVRADAPSVFSDFAAEKMPDKSPIVRRLNIAGDSSSNG